MMVEVYDHQCQLKRTKKQENPAIILSSPCETSSNGVHLPGGGGGTPLFGLYGDVPLDRVWFLASLS